ncbi:MAG TPA: SLBB domain-containing protein [Bacteroidota bacterium]|nr:SLBB domain-containing protein [Bacteroidota bacterium]
MKTADRCLLFLVLTLLIAAPHRAGIAQTTSQTKRPDLDFDIFGDKEKSSAVTVVQPKGLALESVIAAEKYYVGPSDVFSVNIWSSPPLTYQLTVTPEGTLILPMVGEIHVASLTLAAAREKALAALHRAYLRSEVTMTLVTPRPLVVFVQGQVLNPGSYTMAAYNRVDKAVEEADRPLVNQNQYQRDAVERTASRRRIIVRHTDGSLDRVDVPKFLATAEDRWDPYLREGDRIVVPVNDFDRNVIGVYGEVNAPGRIEFAEGDSVKDALRIAYGFTPHALADSVELSRQDSAGRIIERAYIDGRKVMEGEARDIALEPGDRVLVPGVVDERGDFRVVVIGEVRHPGTYPISRTTSRLSRVIATAGGFTDNASLETAEVQRHTLAPDQADLERLQSLRGGVPPDDSAYYDLETSFRLRKEVVNVDFAKLFRGRDSTEDVTLLDGDVISVPSLKKTVYVFGQVVNPGHVPFAPGQDVWYYIRKAGGATDRAREGDVKLVKAKTRQWLSPSGQTVEQGDYVWVPKDPERPFGYYLNIVAQSAAVISVALSAIAIAIQVRK